MPRTEAQRRAQRNYEKKLKEWRIKLKPDLFDEIEKIREARGQSRKEFLITAAGLHKEQKKN